MKLTDRVKGTVLQVQNPNCYSASFTGNVFPHVWGESGNAFPGSLLSAVTSSLMSLLVTALSQVPMQPAFHLKYRKYTESTIRPCSILRCPGFPVIHGQAVVYMVRLNAFGSLQFTSCGNMYMTRATSEMTAVNQILAHADHVLWTSREAIFWLCLMLLHHRQELPVRCRRNIKTVSIGSWWCRLNTS